MDRICQEYKSTGRCRRKECKYIHTRDVFIEKEACAVCSDPAQCVTVCKHFFCYSCARGFITQCTKCIICQEETAGVVYITVNEKPNL